MSIANTPVNTIIECRNKPVSSFDNNLNAGDWVTNIQEQVTLYEGDTIMTRNVFIDTKATSQQKIIIDKDLELEGKFILYNTNWGGATEHQEPYCDIQTDPSVITKILSTADGGTTGADVRNDGKHYVPCTWVNSNDTINEDLEIVDQVEAKAVYAFQESGGFEAAAFFKDPTGVDKIQRVYIPHMFSTFGADIDYINLNAIYQKDHPPTMPAGAPGAGSPQSTPIALYLQQGSKTDFSKRLDNNVVYSDTQFPPLTSRAIPFDKSSKIFQPAEFSFNVTLKGDNTSYEPTELAEELNRLLVEINPQTVNHLFPTGNNQFLQHVGKGAPYDPSLNINNNAFNHFLPIQTADEYNEEHTPGQDYSTHGYRYNNVCDIGQRWVGASTVELAYDQESRTFNWDYLHTPLYKAEAPAVGLFSELQFPNQHSKTFTVAQNGGVMWTSLSAKEVDTGNYVPFWEQTLGFGRKVPGRKTLSLKHLYADFTIVGKMPGTNDGFATQGISSSVPLFKSRAFEGETITGGFQGIDTVVQKGDSAGSTPFWKVPDVMSTGLFASSDKTVKIQAPTSVLNASTELTFGYFLVSIQAQFKNKLIAPDADRGSTMAIVSRYYQQDSYTSASTEAAVVYTHRGPPTLLSSFACRILDSDGNLASNIGTDNTVFLQIIRAPPKVPALMPPPGKDKDKKTSKQMGEDFFF